jgi:hypothetical protein
MLKVSRKESLGDGALRGLAADGVRFREQAVRVGGLADGAPDCVMRYEAMDGAKQ